MVFSVNGERIDSFSIVTSCKTLIGTVSIQASLPFVPSAAAQALVQQSAAQLQERRWAAAADRRRLMALTNSQRCSMQPVYGEDLLRAVHVDLPVHHVNVIKDKVIILIDLAVSWVSLYRSFLAVCSLSIQGPAEGYLVNMVRAG